MNDDHRRTAGRSGGGGAEPGLLAAGAVEAMIRETLRRRAGKELLEAADKLAAAKFPPMTMAEIQEEVDAVRSERRRRGPAG